MLTWWHANTAAALGFINSGEAAMAMLNNLFGKGKAQVGDVEFWHGQERAGWLMKQGEQEALSKGFEACHCTPS